VPQVRFLNLGLEFDISCLDTGDGEQPDVLQQSPQPFNAPNDRSTPKFDHSMEMTLPSGTPLATIPHVYPEPRRVPPNPAANRALPWTPSPFHILQRLPPAHFAPPLCGSPYQYQSMDLTLPLFSYSYALFCNTQNAIPNLLYAFRTLCAKDPGRGALLPPLHRHLVTSLPHSFAHS
jgi:hypothetical protein